MSSLDVSRSYSETPSKDTYVVFVTKRINRTFFQLLICKLILYVKLYVAYLISIIFYHVSIMF